jgi:hypothetical protein
VINGIGVAAGVWLIFGNRKDPVRREART